jgi:hypothetical protein
MTQQQVEDRTASALRKFKTLNGDAAKLILHEKADILRRTGLLKYLAPPDGGLELIGGNDNVKRHIARDKACLSANTQAFGIDPPRGLFLTGIPGCGKTQIALSTASEMGIPLIQFDVGAMMSNWVGEKRTKHPRDLAAGGGDGSVRAANRRNRDARIWLHPVYASSQASLTHHWPDFLASTVQQGRRLNTWPRLPFHHERPRGHADQGLIAQSQFAQAAKQSHHRLDWLGLGDSKGSTGHDGYTALSPVLLNLALRQEAVIVFRYSFPQKLRQINTPTMRHPPCEDFKQQSEQQPQIRTLSPECVESLIRSLRRRTEADDAHSLRAH